MIVGAIIFVVLGILIKYGKMYFLIARYNGMTEEEKEKYDIDKIATVCRDALFGMAIIFVAGYFLAKFTENPDIEIYAFWIAMVLGMPYLLIKSNSESCKK
ncbi:MAG: DUF3784 domain-containing protein [Flavobacteriaceae bacterium]|nr:DUF3784 domain-containing protein [Flavobacteriaceae bacterium]